MLGAFQGLLQATDDVDDEKGRGGEKEDDGGDCDDEIVK